MYNLFPSGIQNDQDIKAVIIVQKSFRAMEKKVSIKKELCENVYIQMLYI